MSIRVLIYEDNVTLREALSFLIEATPSFVLAGAFGDTMLVEKQVGELTPDVVLMDIEMPGQDGIQAVLKIRRQFAPVDVLMLTVFDDDERVFQALSAGATGYLLKKTAPARIMEAISEVYNGGAPMSPAIARRVLLSLRQPAISEEMAQLTNRETEVLSLLAGGLSYKLVAVEAGISIETVRTHVKRIYEKLHVHSVTEAIARYRR
ncbi:response regulator [Larkinella terrae]|uniref:Response regulator n=1 Tax=Larkinella terrae TaxID=2025311 RepID=A0A7K0EUL1_9BACT|nr:response regulator transcription factor [Larkinella terrae]MRS65503.1 response regulator [Larkinella terrae]